MAEYIERGYLLAEYDRQHKGSPGKARELIANAPAADVAPVRRGRWTDHRTIEHDGEWYCSECNKEITIYMGPDRKDRYAYCPNCWAKMEDTE